MHYSLILAVVYEHEEVDLIDNRLRRRLTNHLKQHIPTREPKLTGTTNNRTLNSSSEPEHGSLHRQRAPGVLAGGEHERDGRQVPGAELEARAQDDALVPADELGRVVRAEPDLVVHHSDAPERRVGAQWGLENGRGRGVRACEFLVHVEVDVGETVVAVSGAGDMDGGEGRCQG